MNEVLAYKNRFEGFGTLIFLLSCLVFGVRIGNIGIGYLLTCFMIYEVMWVILGEKLSEYIGRSLRSKLQIRKYKSARIIWRYSLSMSFFTGFIAMLIIGFTGSYLIKEHLHIGHAANLIWVFAPLFMLRLLSETISGYLCGRKNSIPIAGISFVIRYLGILIFGNIGISLIGDYANKAAQLFKQEDFLAMYACVAIGVSAVISETITLIFLLVMKLISKQRAADYDDNIFQKRDNTGNVFIMIWKKRIFEVINSLLVIFPFVVGFVFLFKNFTDSYLGVTKLGLFVLTVLVPALIFSVFGKTMLASLSYDITYNIKENKMRFARNMFQTGFHLCFIYGSFGCMYLIAEGSIILQILGQANGVLAARLLRYGAFISLTMLASLFIMRVLIQNGYMIFVYIVQVPTCIIFVILLKILVSKCDDITIAFAIALLVELILKFIGYLLVSLIKMDMSVDPINNCFVPIVVAVVVCLINILISKMIAPHLGNPFTLLISFVEMIILYLIILLLIRNFKDNELKYLPGGRFVTSLGQTLHVL